MLKNSIIILNFGAQYVNLIARRVREAGVYAEILPFDTPAKLIKKHEPRGIILSGGPASVYLKGAPRCSKKIFSLGIPILGICYGMQLEALLLGGQVTRGQKREYGPVEIKIKKPDFLFEGLSRKLKVWMSHTDQVTRLPRGFISLAQSKNTPQAAIADRRRKIYGVQFHPEVAHTEHGQKILKNFVFRLCGAQKNWRLSSFIEETIAKIKKEVGSEPAICALSGGVDSSVAATLVHKAIGSRLTCVFVDTGLLRSREREEVVRIFRWNQKIKLRVVKAEKQFLGRLKGVFDPEEKRKIIGHTFIEIFEKEAKKLGNVPFLVQGTLYSDLIESGARRFTGAARIKTHHNVGGLPKGLQFKLIEPLADLFKDEVRKVGLELGLSRQIIERQPFPGPGLAIQVMGEVTRTRLERVRLADKILVEELKKAGLYHPTGEAFAVLTNTKSTGVMGDDRTYFEVVALRVVEAEDVMTAHPLKIPYEVLEKISSRIVNEIPRVNRVVYDITTKPPATIRWE